MKLCRKKTSLRTLCYSEWIFCYADYREAKLEMTNGSFEVSPSYKESQHPGILTPRNTRAQNSFYMYFFLPLPWCSNKYYPRMRRECLRSAALFFYCKVEVQIGVAEFSFSCFFVIASDWLRKKLIVLPLILPALHAAVCHRSALFVNFYALFTGFLAV